MRRGTPRELVAVGALIATVGLLVACAHAPERRSIPVLTALNLPPVGPVAYVPAQLHDQVVLVNFFATWCAPCLAQLPVMQELQTRFGKKGLAVVAVGLDREGWLVLQPFAGFYKYGFPVLLGDEPLRNGSSPFGMIAELPVTVLIAKDGQVLHAFAGTASAASLAPKIEKALAEP